MSKSFQQQFDEALACQTREEADAWLQQEAQVLLAMHHQPFEDEPLARAKTLIRQSLGYMTGYYRDPAIWQQIYELFDAPHPFFGTPQMRAVLTVEDAFAAGQRWAERGFRPEWDGIAT